MGHWTKKTQASTNGSSQLPEDRAHAKSTYPSPQVTAIINTLITCTCMHFCGKEKD
jgi:hypothetical protein